MTEISFFLCGFILLACSASKTTSASMNTLYKRWQLVSVTDKQTGKKQNFADKNLFVTFTKDNRLQFNLDVNSCEGKFVLSGKDEILMNPTDFVCTQACCDSIQINYIAVKRYEIEGKTLKLFSEKEIIELKAVN